MSVGYARVNCCIVWKKKVFFFGAVSLSAKVRDLPKFFKTSSYARMHTTVDSVNLFRGKEINYKEKPPSMMFSLEKLFPSLFYFSAFLLIENTHLLRETSYESKQVALMVWIRRSFPAKILQGVEQSMNWWIDQKQAFSRDRLRPVEWPAPYICLSRSDHIGTIEVWLIC